MLCWRSLLLLVALSRCVAQETVPISIDLVLSLCKEEHAHQHTQLVKILEATASRPVRVSVVAYCKCGPSEHHRHLVCRDLPNVGREAHSFAHHVIESFDAPSSESGGLADITFFLNGGFGDVNRFRSATNLAARVGAAAHDLYYADPGHLVSEPTLWTPRESSEAFLERAAAFQPQCGPEGPTNENLCCRGLCRKTHCCHLFIPSVCPFRFMVFDEQTTCEWQGWSLKNYDGTFNRTLQPADPPLWPLWLTRHWGVSFDTWDQAEWAPGGVFAASRQALRSISKERWVRARDALAETSNGGVEGHYMERAWRVLLAVKEQASAGGPPL